ncbi:UNVERIFIED_CONTAM: hypothetical protein GTU68_053840 [Idotea baltica]|nr:hypothetical protein [Idotea baltica]
MLDIGWWELAVVGMVALIVVGPGELPALLRTIGRYVGMAKRQADEFRTQFDEAIRESEFNDLRNEMNEIKSGVTSTIEDAQSSIAQEAKSIQDEYDADKDSTSEPTPEFSDGDPAIVSDKPNGAGGDGPTADLDDADPSKLAPDATDAVEAAADRATDATTPPSPARPDAEPVR